MKLNELSKPFAASDIEWRVGQAGLKQNGEPWAKVLAYVTNRAIMERLDEICGAENWQNEYKEAPCGGVLCGLSIYIEDRGIGDRWVTKWDGAENTDIEGVKGGLSGSMKRAGSQWGIGRYLYGLEDGFATIVQKGAKGAKSAKTKDNKWFYWLPPQLPTWALPNSQTNTYEEKPYTDIQKKIFDNAIKKKEARSFWALKEVSAEEAYMALFSSFEPGTVTRNKDVCRKLEPDGAQHWNKLIQNIQRMIKAEDAMGLAKEIQGFKEHEKHYLVNRIGKANSDKLGDLIKSVPKMEKG